ncbi:MAG: hypothetical protein KC983_04445, partial [Phycisphaerales bacterium]|nr:hypothetical protein [Phycisphaerales bacterium]
GGWGGANPGHARWPFARDAGRVLDCVRRMIAKIRPSAILLIGDAMVCRSWHTIILGAHLCHTCFRIECCSAMWVVMDASYSSGRKPT